MAVAIMRRAGEWFPASRPESSPPVPLSTTRRGGTKCEAVLTEDATHVGAVVQLGAEHAARAPPVAVHLGRSKHAEGRSREVDPPARPGPAHERRPAGPGGIQPLPRE